MKLFSFLILFLFPISNSLTAKTDTLDIAFFKPLVKEWQIIYNNGDAKAFNSLYTEDSRYISGHVDGLVASGREAVINNFQKGMSLGGHIDDIELLSVEHSCDIVVLFCRYKANNAGQKADGRNLLVLKKVNNKWLIHLHMTAV